MHAVITRTAENTYTVVTDVFMSDGTYRADYDMLLIGDTLKPRQGGGIRVDHGFRVKLDTDQLVAVLALGFGELVRL